MIMRPRGNARQEPVANALAFESALKEPESQHEEGERLDLLDMLDPPDGRSTKGGGKRGHDCARRMPAAIPEKHEDGEARERQKREAIKIELPKAWGGLQVGKQERRRKDQRLRIGDLRRSSEHIMGPEGRLARMQRICQKLKLRLKMRLGIVRNGYLARQPWKSEYGPPHCECDQRRAIVRSRACFHRVAKLLPPFQENSFSPASRGSQLQLR